MSKRLGENHKSELVRGLCNGIASATFKFLDKHGTSMTMGELSQILIAAHASATTATIISIWDFSDREIGIKEIWDNFEDMALSMIEYSVMAEMNDGE